MFTGLPQTPKPWKSVACSFVLQVAGVAALVAISMLPGPKIVKQAVLTYVPLTAPEPEVRQPEPERIRPVTPPPIQAPPVVARLNMPRPTVRPPEPVAPPEVKLQTEEFVPVAPQVVRPQAPRVVQTDTFKTEVASATPAPTPQKIETGGFSTGSSATPNSKLAVNKVQTGGFGDPNGVQPSANARPGQVQMARMGSFDLPPGGGQGNGTGGTSGARAVVASSGFGNGVATSTPGKGGPVSQAPQTGGFGEARAAVPPPVRRAAIKAPDMTGVEILHKPAPEYTEEARRLRVEGEVLVEVIFTASGNLQIVRIVRGLGHGLDEAAVRAAERVRFKPATREGRPVDSKATLHIVFQIA
ncbi:MAG: energy transducer TonB [Candidatus Korobacteraceae bacterium]